MMQITLQERITESKDWATVLFIFSFALIAITKNIFGTRFSDFSRLIISNKYIKIYRENPSMMNWFIILLFWVQIISFSFLIQIFLSRYNIVSKTDYLTFIRITTLLIVFILSKYVIEKIIAVLFDIEEFIEQFNFQKVSYRTYISICFLPFIIFAYYNNTSISLINSIIFSILSINTLVYINSLKMYQNLIIGKMFYFILYLCTLEIAPYYLLYYWFTKESIS
ncbi:MAG: DUF4271 domain-containing protein [Flavobacterium sp.]